MPCDACQAAEADVLSAQWGSNCDGCRARALVWIGGHVEAQEAGTITPHYRETLERLFGDRWKAGHAMVKTWGERMRAARKSAFSVGPDARYHPGGKRP